MADPDGENPRLLRERIERNRKGDRGLSQKPGPAPRVEPPKSAPDAANDETG